MHPTENHVYTNLHTALLIFWQFWTLCCTSFNGTLAQRINMLDIEIETQNSNINIHLYFVIQYTFGKWTCILDIFRKWTTKYAIFTHRMEFKVKKAILDFPVRFSDVRCIRIIRFLASSLREATHSINQVLLYGRTLVTSGNKIDGFELIQARHAHANVTLCVRLQFLSHAMHRIKVEIKHILWEI